jgi:excisionase family DNA binding protein
MGSTMNCAEVMRTLRLSRETVKEMLDRGELRGFRRGNVIRIARRSVDRLLGREDAEERSSSAGR